MAEEELRKSSERDFHPYREPLETVMSFKYLGNFFMAGDEDWPEVAGNLQKARKIGVRMTRILIRERAHLKISGHFFKAVVQAVLIFGSEKWILNPRMERALSSVQHRVARRLTGR